ncbi:hypothetical protein HDV05_005706 [Chytridiales sp. JEL 0842]|nr:hypothetical protein HDV05_005706 [Chytridiales sp. JEL 0842]
MSASSPATLLTTLPASAFALLIGQGKVFTQRASVETIRHRLIESPAKITGCSPLKAATHNALMTLASHRLRTRFRTPIIVTEGARRQLCAPADGLGKDASRNPVFINIATFIKNEVSVRLKTLGVSRTLKVTDLASYSIRSAATCRASDATYTLRLGNMAVHAGMAGYPNLIVGMMRNEFMHLPIGRPVKGQRKVDVHGGKMMQAFLDESWMSLD